MKPTLKNLGILDRKHFDAWLNEKLKSDGRYKKLMDSYKINFKKLNEAKTGRGVWILNHSNDPGMEFIRGFQRWDLRLRRLQKIAKLRLERLLDEYRKDGNPIFPPIS